MQLEINFKDRNEFQMLFPAATGSRYLLHLNMGINENVKIYETNLLNTS